MADFLRGFLGTILRWVLGLAGVVLLASGLFGLASNDGRVVGIFLIVLGVLCFAGAVAVKYWLGNIVRIR